MCIYIYIYACICVRVLVCEYRQSVPLVLWDRTTYKSCKSITETPVKHKQSVRAHMQPLARIKSHTQNTNNHTNTNTHGARIPMSSLSPYHNSKRILRLKAPPSSGVWRDKRRRTFRKSRQGCGAYCSRGTCSPSASSRCA